MRLTGAALGSPLGVGYRKDPGVCCCTSVLALGFLTKYWRRRRYQACDDHTGATINSELFSLLTFRRHFPTRANGGKAYPRKPVHFP